MKLLAPVTIFLCSISIKISLGSGTPHTTARYFPLNESYIFITSN